MRVYLLILSLFFCSISFAQNTITGSVTNSNNQPIPGSNVKVVGDTAGTVTDGDGKFILNSSKKAPFTISVTSVGYESKKVSVSASNQKVNVTLSEEETKLDEIVVSASRTPEKIKESPVTIERMGIKEIKKTASATFYDGLENLKEVQMNTSSLSFKSINTRGFAAVSNTRFLQLVDGMDNSSPLLNFVLGNLIGVSEIDVQSVELLPGASSALYGASAFNGILFMNSKDPFKYQGITAYAKYGQTSQKAAGSNDFMDSGIRIAKAFSPYFAGKANFALMQGTDWYATNYEDPTNPALTRANPGYDATNIYGDEVKTNMFGIAQTLVGKGILPASILANPVLTPTLNSIVSRTGYKEVDLTDNKVRNLKIDFSLHARPFGNENLEIIWQSKFGYGNTVYQGANRYNLNNFFMQQHKLEFKGKNFFVRGYTTSENGGSSYDMRFAGINIQEVGKPREVWFPQYTIAYVKAFSTPGSPAQGNSALAHQAARAYADSPTNDGFGTWAGLLTPGTGAFNKAFSAVTKNPDVTKGAKLEDNSKYYHSDANYNFKDLVKFAEIQVGGSFREYVLNSHGRIYTDANGPIKYNEYGAYVQAQKKLLDDRLKFVGSVRYDKAQNYDGAYTPRVAIVFSPDKEKNHTFRASFQTGFRNPSTQDQYIGFDVGTAMLVGSAPDNLTRYSEVRNVSPNGQAVLGSFGLPHPAGITMNGNDAYFDSYTAASVGAFGASVGAANPTNQPALVAAIMAASPLLKKTSVGLVKPEYVKAFDLGYRTDIKGFKLDINGYYNIYNDFITVTSAAAPLYGTATNGSLPVAFAPAPASAAAFLSAFAITQGDYRGYQLYTNSKAQINSTGFGIGVAKKVYKDFEISANYNYANFDFDKTKYPDDSPGFNTPKNKAKVSFSNDKLLPNLGFNISGRWNEAYLWEGSTYTGMIESATVVDAQINYGLTKLKSTLKVGATNLGGKEYVQVYGSGSIGQQYYISWTINP